MREKTREKKNFFCFNPITYPLPLGTGTFFWIGNLKPVSKYFTSSLSFVLDRCSLLEAENSRLEERLQQQQQQQQTSTSTPGVGFTAKDNVQHSNELLYLKVSRYGTINHQQCLNAHFVGKRIDRGLLDRLMVFLYTEEICCKCCHAFTVTFPPIWPSLSSSFCQLIPAHYKCHIMTIWSSPSLTTSLRRGL